MYLTLIAAMIHTGETNERDYGLGADVESCYCCTRMFLGRSESAALKEHTNPHKKIFDCRNSLALIV